MLPNSPKLDLNHFRETKKKDNEVENENFEKEETSWWKYLGLNSEKTLQETYRHKIYETVTNLSSKILPKATSDHLNGHLTPEEFVRAGDYLINKCSSWHWASNQDKLDPSLPPKKQYLVCKGMMCNTTEIPEDDVKIPHSNDMDNWTCPVPEEDNNSTEDSGEQHIYDISLTYDNSTATPRIWLLGYSSEGEPLTMEQITQDIHIDYIGDSVTMIAQPFTGLLNVSIHPCRHAEGMKKLIDNINMNQEELFAIEEYMIIFLKFMSSVVPNMEIKL